MSSITRRISSGGHGAPAMIPVRSVPISSARNDGSSSSATNIVGTPCTRGAPLVADRPQRRARLEMPARDHDAPAVRQAREVRHHHPEAVEERHRHAQPVLLAKPHRPPGEVRVVHDVVVAQHHRLRESRRPRRELDVDRVVRVKLRGAACDSPVLDRPPAREELRPTSGTPAPTARSALDPRDRTPPRGACSAAAAATAPPARTHARSASAPTPWSTYRLVLNDGMRNSALTSDSCRRVPKLRQLVRRVDVHQHRADPRRRQLHQEPLDVVRGPDRDGGRRA